MRRTYSAASWRWARSTRSSSRAYTDGLPSVPEHVGGADSVAGQQGVALGLVHALAGDELGLLVEEREHHIAGRARKPEHALGDADALEVIELAGIRERPEGHDLQGVGISAGLADDLPQPRDGVGEAGPADGDPAVAVLGDVGEQLGARRTAVQHGHAGAPVAPGLDRLRPRPGRREADVLAGEARLLLGPQGLHGEDDLSSHRPTIRHGDAVVLELVLVPTEADAERGSPAAQVIEGRHGLRRDERLALRGQEDPRAEPQRRRGRYGRAQGDERVEAAPVLLGELGVAGGRRRPPADRDVGVLGEPQRLQPPGLRLPRQLDDVDADVGREHRDPVPHAVAPTSVVENVRMASEIDRRRRDRFLTDRQILP